MASADDRPVRAAAEEAGRPRKTCAGSEEVVLAGQQRGGGDGGGQRRIPQWVRARLLLGGGRVEELGGLAVVAPGDAKVKGEVGLDLPVVAGIGEGVMLAEIKRRVAIGD